jgi:FMN phosphatase YigB (HAD superfamily)
MAVTALADDAFAELAARGVRAVLFDVDGTLYSQRRLRVFMAMELVRAALGAPGRMTDTVRIITAFRRTREDLRRLGAGSAPLDDLQFTRTADVLGIEAAVVRRVIDEWIFTRPLPYLRFTRRAGLREVLAALQQQRLHIGALSDYPTDAKLEALGVAPQFSLRLCTTDSSINAFKPHPRGFLLACEQWGLDPQEVLYVGDRPEIDGAGAAAAGTRCVIVGRGGAWGAGRAASTRRFADIARAALAR